MILGVETSCDDTCAAIVTEAGDVRSNVVSSQGLVHAPFGGVVPEVASRHHLELIDAVIADALARAGVGLEDVEKLAVTQGPGLIGALLVGVSAAKALAAARELPLTPVDHLHGHVVASTLGVREECRSGVAGGAQPERGGRSAARAWREERSPSVGRASTGPSGLGRAPDRAVSGEHRTERSRPSTAPPDRPIEPPYLVLVASGGHTFLARVDEPAGYTVLGQTLDDAAGEAFDKGARLLGLGYPGGPELDRLARTGDAEAFAFPRSAPGEGLDFSFSGLKTALLYRLRDDPDASRPDLAASYQQAIVDALLVRVGQALEQEGLTRLALGGGVAANSKLRDSARALGVAVWVPPVELCTDNAAMIAGAARFLKPLAYPDYLKLDAAARLV
ncbi:MAG: tRNA (adenosine(37)-N6)-threonylcarbamoyltransferase complex transferase subunit TsaD [Actinomycetota bacterium]|nr:tRNA (adenosine(37)-N6)-threonylcarbamoyltransferase complex transferase subunit TsaD [Actinomycetota bacterium]